MTQLRKQRLALLCLALSLALIFPLLDSAGTVSLKDRKRYERRNRKEF